jgi:hypothetical protein
MSGFDWQAATAKPEYRAAKLELLTVRVLKTIRMTEEMACAVEKACAQLVELNHIDPNPDGVERAGYLA